MSSIKKQFIIDGVLTLTEGERYRVKSGAFSGMVGTFIGLERQYPMKEAPVGGTLGSGSQTMTYEVEKIQEAITRASLHVRGVDEEQGSLSLNPYNLELVK